MLYTGGGGHLPSCFPLLIWDAICRGSFSKVFPFTDLECYMQEGVICQGIFPY